MRRISILATTLFLFCCSCRRGEKQYVLVTAKLSDRQVASFDTAEYCTIPIDTFRNYYYKTFSINANDILCGYNHTKQTLDYFSIKQQKMLGTTKLRSEKINLSYGIKDVLYKNADSIFLFDGQSQIYLIDSVGDVRKTIQVNSPTDNSIFRHIVLHDWDMANNMYYDKVSESLYLPTMSVDETRGTPAFYKAPLLIKINLRPQISFNTIPIYYSPLYTLHYFGFADAPKFSFLDSGKITYSFGVEPNIYIYDIKKGTTIVSGGASRKYPFVSKSLEWESVFDDDLKMDNLLHNVDYQKLLKDPYRNLYYRLQYNPVKDLPERAATENDRKQFLTIYDSKMQIIKTIELADRRYVLETSFVTKGGLYILAPGGYKALLFKIFRFNIK